MGNSKYEEFVTQIISLVGGKENVNVFTHCATRLRFNVRDKSIVHFDEIKGLSGAVGAVWSGEQLQVIIGNVVIDAIAGYVTPIIPVLVGSGLLKILLLLGELTGFMSSGPTYDVLTFASDAGFYFLPVFGASNTSSLFPAILTGFSPFHSGAFTDTSYHAAIGTVSDRACRSIYWYLSGNFYDVAV